ncbi:MAG: transglycosylase SLT domain-containing protein [Vicinamibacterales bacterium]
MTRVATGLLAAAGLIAAATVVPHAQQAAMSPDRGVAGTSGLKLAPTDHPRLSLNANHLWLAPDGGRATAATGALQRALALFDEGKDAQALAALSTPDAQAGVLGPYATYYAARAQMRLDKHVDALRMFRAVQERDLPGYLREAAAIGEAEALEAEGDHDKAAAIYDRLSKTRPLALDDILMRFAREAEAAGDEQRALEAYARVYYEFPLGEFAPTARTRLDLSGHFQRLAPGSQRLTFELGRAQRLFGARRYDLARSAFAALKPMAEGDDRDLASLRIAEADYHLKRYRQAREALAPFTTKGSRQGEALYFHALASRALGDNATYLKNVRLIVDRFSDQTWAADALSHLATQYIRQDEDEAADTVFRELIERFPRSSLAERAIWKVGWRSFLAGRYDETAELFERAAVDFPRSDYRPAWLFWSGRAHERRERPTFAQARYTLAAADYLNTYYGRLAVQRLGGRVPAPRVIADAPTPAAPPPPNEPFVRALLEIGRYDDALNELKYAQRQWGESSALQATTAWVLRQQGLSARGREQFNLLRGSINTMRRAYPQFMAAGGEHLPREVLSIIFPISYWDLIQKYSALNDLDPHLVAALVAQESTFVPDIRSSANAVGLMQLIPSTARAYARKLGLRYSAKLMTNPEANIRMGTAYLSDKIREFGSAHLALASYNAGERPVRRWLSERPGVPVDQFIDDIPYPETQNYVKRILGTTEDYRRLYGATTTTRAVTMQGPAGEAAVPVFTATGGTLDLVSDEAVRQVTDETPVKAEPVKRRARPAPRPARKRTPPRKSSRSKRAASSR